MPRKRRPVLGRDYIICEDGRAQFTGEFLATRGWCCEADCRFCPFPPEVRYASQRRSEEEDAELVQVGVTTAGDK
jgi:hypothetical protein